jgi:hypothetical protein
VIEIIDEDGDPGVPGRGDEGLDRLEVVGEFDALDVDPGRHDLLDGAAAEFDDALDHVLLGPVDLALTLAFADDGHDLLVDVMHTGRVFARETLDDLVHGLERRKDGQADEARHADEGDGPGDDGDGGMGRDARRDCGHEDEHPGEHDDQRPDESRREDLTVGRRLGHALEQDEEHECDGACTTRHGKRGDVRLIGVEDRLGSTGPAELREVLLEADPRDASQRCVQRREAGAEDGGGNGDPDHAAPPSRGGTG